MRNIDGETQLMGIIGWPVAHSFSPTMHNAAAAAAGLNWVYVPLPVRPENVETAVQGLLSLGFRGANVTVPYKQSVIPFLDEVEAGAEAIGAVNTIVVAKGAEIGGRLLDIGSRLVGYNTDWSGFLADLEAHNVWLGRRDCLVLGAGGSARAVTYALVTAGAKVQVLARRPEQAKRLVTELRQNMGTSFEENRLQSQSLAALTAVVAASDKPLIVNTTPVGMYPIVAKSVWPDGVVFPTGSFVYDLVYNPLRTRLMEQAEAAGCKTANGLGMLIQQGVQAFKLWTGQMPDRQVMVQAVSQR